MRFEGRTAIAAVRAARDHGQLALSCLSNGVLIVGVGNARAARYTISLGGAFEASVGGGLKFDVYEDYDAVGLRSEFTAARVAYRYRVFAEDRELLVYHWNPAGPEGKDFPHLHLSAAAELGNRSLTRAHIPTGQVGLSDVVRLLIEELGVRTRRADWRAVLGDAVG